MNTDDEDRSSDHQRYKYVAESAGAILFVGICVVMFALSDITLNA